MPVDAVFPKLSIAILHRWLTEVSQDVRFSPVLALVARTAVQIVPETLAEMSPRNNGYILTSPLGTRQCGRFLTTELLFKPHLFVILGTDRSQTRIKQQFFRRGLPSWRSRNYEVAVQNFSSDLLAATVEPRSKKLSIDGLLDFYRQAMETSELIPFAWI